ncbi:MAG: tripartite tricarboxylate transporter substrate-binding protein [Pseudolabrys sp.]
MSFNIRVRGIVSQAVIGLSVLCLAYTMPAQAVDYPTRTVRLLVGWGPGDFPDVVGRLVAAKLSEKWGQAVVVENRMGANGTIASDIVAHAPPDGYTLVVITPNHTNTSNWLKLNYDPIKSFAPVAELAAQPDVIFASKSFPVNTIPELLALAKSKPGEINFGSTGPGSPSYLAMAVLLQKAGVKMASIQYKSSSAALTAMIGGENTGFRDRGKRRPWSVEGR